VTEIEELIEAIKAARDRQEVETLTEPLPVPDRAWQEILDSALVNSSGVSFKG